MTNPRKLTVLSSALLLASLTACGGGGGGGGSDDDTPRNPEKPLTTLPQFLQGNEALCDFIESGKTVSLQNYTGDLGNVTGLTCNGVTLSDLDEISLLTALQQLSLDSAGLTNVTELLNNLTLQQLDLSGNPIADLSIITSLLNLTELDLENTGLSDISLLNALTALQQLDVSGNAITDVAPLGNLLNLTDLDLSANNITELDALGALTSLNNLDVSGNPSLSCAEINDLALASAADITVPSNCTSAAFLSASSDATQTLDNSSLAEPIERLVIRDVNSLDDLQMFQSGDDLRLTANTSGGIKTIIFTHWFVDATYQVDEFEVEGVGVYGFAALRAQIGLGLTLTEGRDTYLGTDGRDVVYGLGEADIIAGGGQADVIVGGPGNDIVSGSRLNIAADGTVSRNNTSDGYQDTFIYNLGDDHDTIYEYETGAEKRSLLQFGTGISSEDISLYQDGKDLIIELNDTDKLTVDSWFEGSQYYYRLGYVQFQTGDPIEASQWVASKGFQSTNGEVAGTSLAESLVGSDNDDRIYGLGGADIIEGGEGNDHLSGNRLNIAADGTVSVFGSSDVAMDTFIFNLGDDHDTLYEYETSAEYRALLQFGAGISPDDIIVIRDSDDLILEINEEDKVTINNWYQGTQGYHRIGTIQFGSDDPVNASTWINSKTIHFQESGTLEGTSEANILLGTAGVDYIMGYGREDVIEGGEGNDHLSGNRLNIAADGTVSVFGSPDSAVDTFIFNLGDDQDTLYEYETSAEYRALLQFGAGISPDDIIVIRDSDDLILEINEEDKVTINNWYQGTQGYHRIGTIQFGSDDPVGASTWINSKPIHFQESGTLEGTIEANILLGTAGVDYIMGYGREDVIEGGEGNDHLSGNRLNIAADGSVSVFGSSDNAVDTFIFNLGDDHDTLYEYNTSAQYQSLLRFGPGIIEDAITVTRSGDDVILEINTEDKVTIHNWFAGSAGYYQIGKIQFDGQPAVSAYMFVNSKLNP